MFRKLERFLIPGNENKAFLKLFTAGYIIEIIVSLSVFIPKFRESIQNLYDPRLLLFGRKELVDGAMMESFGTAAAHSMLFLWVILMVSVIWAIMGRVSLEKESKSIYLMKRLPDGKELTRRVIGGPVIAFLIGLCIAVLIMIIYFACYKLIPPAECVASVSVNDFVRAFL